MDNEIDQDRMCELCADAFYEGYVNTNQYNMCEGNRCTDALELLEEAEEIDLKEIIEERNDKIDEILTDEKI